MTFRLTVGDSIADLVDPLAAELARPLADPFTTEIVAVPGDGIRSWLTAHLAARTGCSAPGRADGVVANVRFVFPSHLVSRAIGRRTPSGPWSVGPLTWAIHDVLDGSDLAADFGLRTDAVRCRTIADLFDRYALHRPRMMRAWEGSADVGADGRPVPAHLAWQPELWRRLRRRLGGTSDVETLALAAADLRVGRLEPDLPERVFLVGLAGLPAPHLHVISALASQREVHVLAPAPSRVVWRRLRDHAESGRPLTLPLPRDDDPTATSSTHPLGATWGRAAREAHLLLVDAAVESGASIDEVTGEAEAPGTPVTLLAMLQAGIRRDEPPPGVPSSDVPDERPRLDPDDHSVMWHTCHGPTRQAEVLRDVVLHVLEETDEHGAPRYHPRDIAVLCPDVPTFAPLLESAFAGDPDHDVPPVPLRVADRSLRQQNPFLDAVVQLLDLLEGRFRASEVLAFAGLAPVAQRFGFGPEQLEHISDWVVATHVRWGADPGSQRAVGLPDDLDAHTWRHGLDQLLVGAALADPAMVAAATGSTVGDRPHGDDDTATAERRFGPNSTVAAPDIDAESLALAGAFADLVGTLDAAVRSLTAPTTVQQWCATLAEAVDTLFAVADVDSWQRRDLDAELNAFADEAVVDGRPLDTEIPAPDLVALFRDRLSGRPGRVRFGTGAVTLSSLTAQRGVPHPVVCLLGLDGDLGAGAVAPADDLTQAIPCVGDRDPRAEVRAQLLDALVAAGDRLVVLSTGRDVRTNAATPPIVPLAELADLIDATAVGPDGIGRASAAVTVEHPRQAWAERNLRPGEVPGIAGAPWSFDRGALAAALARRRQSRVAPFLADPLPDERDDRAGRTVTVDELVRTLRNPAETLVRDRLGAWFERDDEPLDDLVPLDVGGLTTWSLRESLLRARLAAGATWDAVALDRWCEARRREGAIPPLGRGDIVLDDVCAAVDRLVDALDACDATLAATSPTDVAVDLDLATLGTPVSRVHGTIAGVRGCVALDISPSRLAPGRRLAAWLRLAVLHLAEPEIEWEALVVGRDVRSRDKVATARLRLRDRAAADEVLELVLDLHERARRDVVPAFPATTYALHHAEPGRGADRAADEWRRYATPGEGDDRWVLAALGPIEMADLLDDPARPDETWGRGSSRIERWAERIWGTVERTTVDASDATDATGTSEATDAAPDAETSGASR